VIARERYGRSVDAVSHEAAIRLAVFLSALGTFAAAEAVAPRRRRAVARSARWPGNLALPLVGTLVVRAVLPTTAVGAAVLAQEQDSGLLHAAGPLPAWVAVAISVVLLDLAIYLQHVLFHRIPVLWRLHRVHHADLDVDVTTGARFHPIELAISAAAKIAVVIALGAPPVAVVLFEVLLNGGSLFNHANLAVPPRAERFLRWLVVTPDMHRVHHSADRRETDSNFGFTLPWWDRLCGTYRADPRGGHDAMVVGIGHFRTPHESRLDRLLLQPFRRLASSHLSDRQPVGR
jgi:sterol desaturase/sphingolipid hydroxylase (fatty acid hydroxylase superfamily)